MIASVPATEDCAIAVARAVAARRERHRGEAIRGHITYDDMAELKDGLARAIEAAAPTDSADFPFVAPFVVRSRGDVQGIAYPPRRRQGDWWTVGLVIDTVTSETFDDCYIPSSSRVGLGRSTT